MIYLMLMAGIMYNFLSLMMIIIIGGITDVIGEITVDPTTMSATVGEEVILRCTASTVNQPVDWMFQPTPEDPQRRICSKGKPFNGYAKYFRVEHVPDTGIYNLILLRAKTTDSGTYICVEDEGFGPDQKSVKLEVKDVLSTVNPDFTVGVISSQTAATTSQLLIIIILTAIVVLIVVLLFVIVFAIKRHRSNDKSGDDCEKQKTPCVQSVESNNKIYIPSGVTHEQERFIDSSSS